MKRCRACGGHLSRSSRILCYDCQMKAAVCECGRSAAWSVDHGQWLCVECSNRLSENLVVRFEEFADRWGIKSDLIYQIAQE